MSPSSKSARVKQAYRVRPEQVVEPEMSAEDWQDFKRAVELFNNGHYWESHEAWELIWRRHLEPSRIFFQGLIQLAAAYHQLRRGIYHGVIKHFNNARWKLQHFPAHFLGVDVEALRDRIEAGLTEAERLGEARLNQFEPALIARIQFRHPDG